MTKPTPTYVAQKIADRMTYRLGRKFRVETSTVRCDGGPDVVSANVVLDRFNTWPLIAAAVGQDGKCFYEVPESKLIAALPQAVAL